MDKDAMIRILEECYWQVSDETKKKIREMLNGAS